MRSSLRSLRLVLFGAVLAAAQPPSPCGEQASLEDCLGTREDCTWTQDRACVARAGPTAEESSATPEWDTLSRSYIPSAELTCMYEHLHDNPRLCVATRGCGYDTKTGRCAHYSADYSRLCSPSCTADEYSAAAKERVRLRDECARDEDAKGRYARWAVCPVADSERCAKQCARRPGCAYKPHHSRVGGCVPLATTEAPAAEPLVLTVQGNGTINVTLDTTHRQQVSDVSYAVAIIFLLFAIGMAVWVFWHVVSQDKRKER